MQNFGLGRTEGLDFQRDFVHSEGTGKFSNKGCSPELGYGNSAENAVAAAAHVAAVAVAVAHSGSVVSIGT